MTPESVTTLDQVWSVPSDFAGQPLVTPGAVFTGFQAGDDLARVIMSALALGWVSRNCSTRGRTFSEAGSWWRRHGRTRVTVGIV